MQETVLVVDDEEPIREILTAWLEEEGYNAVSSANGFSALRELYQHRPDLVVADILMPDMDGYELCRLTRGVSKAPFMFLSALGKEQEKVKGFELGADDYVVKPVGMDEFLARVSALLRRRGDSQIATPGASGYRDSELGIDLDRHEVRCKNSLVELTPTEFKMLVFLTENAGKTCRLHDILAHVWDSTDYMAEVIKWHITRLRAKLEENPSRPARIVTVRGVGYRYEPPVGKGAA